LAQIVQAAERERVEGLRRVARVVVLARVGWELSAQIEVAAEKARGGGLELGCAEAAYARREPIHDRGLRVLVARGLSAARERDPEANRGEACALHCPLAPASPPPLGSGGGNGLPSMKPTLSNQTSIGSVALSKSSTISRIRFGSKGNCR